MIVSITGKSMKQHEISSIACWNAKWYNYFGRYLAVSYKTKHSLIIQYSNCSCIYSTDLKTYVYQNSTCKFFSAVIIKKWEQPRCLSKDECIKNPVIAPYNGTQFGDEEE